MLPDSDRKFADQIAQDFVAIFIDSCLDDDDRVNRQLIEQTVREPFTVKAFLSTIHSNVVHVFFEASEESDLVFAFVLLPIDMHEEFGVSDRTFFHPRSIVTFTHECISDSVTEWLSKNLPNAAAFTVKLNM